MTLIFGNLTQSFVDFNIVLNNVAQGNGTEADVAAAASKLRRVAAKDASYLVYIGQFHHDRLFSVIVATHTLTQASPLAWQRIYI